jgi:hypothetical protein
VNSASSSSDLRQRSRYFVAAHLGGTVGQLQHLVVQQHHRRIDLAEALKIIADKCRRTRHQEGGAPAKRPFGAAHRFRDFVLSKQQPVDVEAFIDDRNIG